MGFDLYPYSIDRRGISIVQETATSFLSGWTNFYVIIGSAAAALTGLTFIVITLVAGARALGGSDTVAAFSSPTVVHFCMALLIAVTLTAPWPMLWHLSLLLALIGLACIIYMIIVVRRTFRQTDYEPVLEDWLWHIIFPFLSYISFFISSLALPTYPVPVLFVIAAGTILLLFIGIHNSWDTVTYLIIERFRQDLQNQDQEEL